MKRVRTLLVLPLVVPAILLGAVALLLLAIAILIEPSLEDWA